MTTARSQKSAQRGPRRPRKATAASLENAALAYLGRFATSADNLRRVLMRRAMRSARIHGTDPAEGAAAIEAIVARYLRLGLLDDRAYADARARSLLRRGASLRAVAADLMAKGVAAELVAATLTRLRGESDDVDLQAATAYARRRRLGPWRKERLAHRARDLAALARQGFPLSVALRVVDAEDVESLSEPPSPV